MYTVAGKRRRDGEISWLLIQINNVTMRGRVGRRHGLLIVEHRQGIDGAGKNKRKRTEGRVSSVNQLGVGLEPMKVLRLGRVGRVRRIRVNHGNQVEIQLIVFRGVWEANLLVITSSDNCELTNKLMSCYFV